MPRKLKQKDISKKDMVLINKIKELQSDVKDIDEVLEQEAGIIASMALELEKKDKDIRSVDNRAKEALEATREALGAQIEALRAQILGIDTSNGMDSVIQQLIGSDFKGVDGKTPTKEELVKLIKPLIPAPLAGSNGVDADEEMILGELTSRIDSLTKDLDGKIEAITLPEETRIEIDGLKTEIKKGLGGSTARNLYQLGDVEVSGASNAEVLTYNSTTQLWENAAAGGGGGTTLDVDFKLDEAGGVSIGDVVYISGSSGSKIEMSLSDNTDFTKIDSIALATSTEIDNAEMTGRTHGLLEGLDTSAFVAGDRLYLSTAGTWTSTHPTGIDAVVTIGYVVKVNASTGSIFVNISSQTIANNHNGTVRHQLVNENAGASASAAYTLVNDGGHRASIALNSTDTGGTGESMTIYNQGYGNTNNILDGNHDHIWYTDVGDTHNFSATEKMRLTAAGSLGIGTATPTDTLDVIGDVMIDHTAVATDEHALEIDVDAAGFGDIKAVDVAYTTGAIGTGDEEGVMLLNIDETASTGGEVFGMEVLTTAEGSATIVGMKTGINVDPIGQFAGTFIDADSILNKAVDVLTALSTGGAGNISVFVADNDTITIGSANKFEELEFILDTGASGGGVAPTFEFSTGIGTWTTFTPTDGTNGFRNTGVVLWDDADAPTWATGTGSEYLIRITRTRNSLGTTPILDLIQLAGVTVYSWDKDGDITIRKAELSGQMYQTSVPTSTPTGTTETIDFDTGQAQILDLGSATGDVTLTLSNLREGGAYTLKVIQGATARNLVFPSGTIASSSQSAWTQGTRTVTMTATNDAVDVVGLTRIGSETLLTAEFDLS